MIPLSEEKIMERGEMTVVKAGEVFERTLGFDLLEGERKEIFLRLELHDGAECSMSIFVRGEGGLFLHRVIDVLGNDVKLTVKVFGETRKKSNVYCSDDVQVTGERALIDMRTKIVLRDEAKSEARQRIVLLPSAHGANATQKIDHLLLGDHAVAESLPELDVQLDDVICTHGATISRPDESAMFYLLSRGLTREDAENTFVHGFLALPTLPSPDPSSSWRG
jgi:Fe-S cluster assembly scaffold protein SufB